MGDAPAGGLLIRVSKAPRVNSTSPSLEPLVPHGSFIAMLLWPNEVMHHNR